MTDLNTGFEATAELQHVRDGVILDIVEDDEDGE